MDGRVEGESSRQGTQGRRGAMAASLHAHSGGQIDSKNGFRFSSSLSTPKLQPLHEHISPLNIAPWVSTSSTAAAPLARSTAQSQLLSECPPLPEQLPWLPSFWTSQRTPPAHPPLLPPPALPLPARPAPCSNVYLRLLYKVSVAALWPGPAWPCCARKARACALRPLALLSPQPPPPPPPPFSTPARAALWLPCKAYRCRVQ